MVKIFINYRRSDTEADAGRLQDHLVAALGQANVFMDVTSVAPGQDFVVEIEQRLAAADIVLTLIGPGWLNAQDESGERRLDNPDDFVRLELEQALKANKVVIPILIRGAVMPQEKELPTAIPHFARRNAIPMFHRTFQRDVQTLVDAIHVQNAITKSSRMTPDDVANAITREYDRHFSFEMRGEHYRLQLVYGSETASPSHFQSHLITEAVVQLIEESDLSLWEKSESEVSPDRFWSALLNAIGSSFLASNPHLEGWTTREIIVELARDLNDKPKRDLW